MRRTASSARLALLLSVWPLTAHAQDSVVAPKTVEVSAAVSGFTASDLLGLGVRVSGRTGGRSSIEAGLDWTDAFHTRQLADQIVWFYFWQMKHTVWANRRTSVFATYGTSGWIERQSVPPGRLKSSVLPPFLPLVGAGTQHVIASRMAIRFDAQFLIWPFEGGLLFPRIGAGVTVPIGRYAH
jgi:hypothetical protein